MTNDRPTYSSRNQVIFHRIVEGVVRGVEFCMSSSPAMPATSPSRNSSSYLRFPPKSRPQFQNSTHLLSSSRSSLSWCLESKVSLKFGCNTCESSSEHCASTEEKFYVLSNQSLNVCCGPYGCSSPMSSCFLHNIRYPIGQSDSQKPSKWMESTAPLHQCCCK